MMKNKKKINYLHKQPGDLIQLLPDQEEPFRVRGRYINNPEMEEILLEDLPSEKHKMQFSGVPLPWDKPMTPKDFNDLYQALGRKFTCKKQGCKSNNAPCICKYEMVIRKKQIKHINNFPHNLDETMKAALEQLEINRFGRRERVELIIIAKCIHCGSIIQQVKYTNANRRAAEDPTINGPHIKKHKYSNREQVNSNVSLTV